MIQPDLSIIKISESGKHEVNPYDFDFESSDQEETNSRIKQEEKMKSHQNDRYGNKMIGQGLFLLAGSQSFDTTHFSSEQQKREDPKKKTHKNLSDPEVEYRSSKIRMGQEGDLPSIKKLPKIGVITQESLAQVSKPYKELLNSPDVKWKVTKYKPEEIENYPAFIKNHIPTYKTLNTLLHRDRSGLKRFFPMFNVEFAEEQAYIMSCKRMCGNATSAFHITANSNNLKDDDDDFMGVLESNFAGSLYNLYENSKNKQPIATIVHKSEVTLKQTPRSIEVYLISPFYSYEKLEGTDDNKNLKELYEIGANAQNKKILKFVSKKPVWNRKKQSYVLDFHGKAKISSVKNMILVEETTRKQVMLLAKCSDHTFVLDIHHPLSPRIALAIASSSFDWKWISQ